MALRARVNPHFLFNALHSVGALVASDPVRADKHWSVSAIPRYALARRRSAPLAGVAFTQDYLAFEQLRLAIGSAYVRPRTQALSTTVPPLSFNRSSKTPFAMALPIAPREGIST